MDPPDPLRQQAVPDVASRFRRNYVRGVILALVTLGFYGLWWHWNVHKELCGHLGRPMRGEKVWYAFVMLYFTAFVLGVWEWIVQRVIIPGQHEVMTVAFLGSVTYPMFGVALSAPVALVLFIVYVKRQYEAIRDAKGALGIPVRGGLWRFLPLFLVGLALAFIPIIDPLINALGWGLVAAAYRYIQEDYNEIWGAVDLWQSRHVERAAPTTSPFPR